MARFMSKVFLLLFINGFSVNCGGGDSCENPNPNYDATDSTSVFCLDSPVPATSGLTAGGDESSENAEESENEEGEESSESSESSGEEETGGDEAPGEEGGEAPGEEGGEAPGEEGGEISGEEGAEEGTTEEGDELSTEEGDEASTEEGDEASTDEGDETSTDEGDEASTEEGDETGEEFPGCPPVDLTGSYALQFKISLDEKPWELTMNIGMVDGPECYGGTFVSSLTGNVVGSVTSVVLNEGNLELTVADFLIPAGENALLPDGGKGDLVLTATEWGENPTLCGDVLYKLAEPFETQDIGTFAAVIQSSEFYLNPGEGYACDMIQKEDTGDESPEEEGGEGDSVCGDGLCDAGEKGPCAGDCSGPGVIYTIKTTSDFTSPNFKKFEPSNLSIAAGDKVRFMMTNMHNAVEVSEQTFQEVGVTNLEGGFSSFDPPPRTWGQGIVDNDLQ